MGDKHCGWRSLSWRLFGSENAWRALRLLIMFYAYQESIEIELCEGLIASYVDIIEGELKDLVSRCPEEIEQHLYHHFAGHPDHQCGLWEMSVASIFFGPETTVHSSK